jgi:hypothetical protein
MDFQEQTRMQDNYNKLNKIIDLLNDLDVGPSLVWLYTWDMIKHNLDYYTEDSGETLIVNPAISEPEAFQMMWEEADKQGFTLEYGNESLSEHVFDWMVDKNLLIDVE